MKFKTVWVPTSDSMRGHWNTFSYSLVDGRLLPDRKEWDEYNLKMKRVQQRVLAALARADAPASAEQFFKQWGAPISLAKIMTLSEIINYAKSLQWLIKILTATEREDFETLSGLMQYGKRRSGMYVTFTPPHKIFGRLQNTNPDSNRPMKLTEIDPVLLKFGCNVLEWHDDYYVAAAYGLLELVFNRVLHGAVPVASRPSWKRDHESSLIPLCPWQAAHIALYEDWRAGTNFKSCANPNCNEVFQRSRDKVYCGRDACRKWCSRNLGFRYRTYNR